jgi:hypothetical protein
MSAGDPEVEPEGRTPVWARWLMRISIVFGIATIAWNVWVIRGLVMTPDEPSVSSWPSVVIQTTVGILLIAQGLFFRRNAR